jgi:hypothetical protein
MSEHLSDERIMLYLDDELLAPERSGIEAHLAGCADCAAQAERWQRVFQRIESVEPIASQRSLAPAVMQRLQSAPRFGRPLRWLVAAQLLVGALVAGFLLTATGRTATRSTLAEAGLDPSLWWSDIVAGFQAEASALSQELLLVGEQLNGSVTGIDLPSAAEIPWLVILLGVGFAWLITNGWLLRQEHGLGGMLTGARPKEANHG